MILAIIIGLILLLYLRTYNYNYVIDDYVRRENYPHPHPKPIDVTFYDTKPTWYYRMFMIGMHSVNTTIIYLMWGWEPALLFAVHPMGIWGTAWVTGNYYATTAFMSLVAYFLLHQFHNIWGAISASVIFWGALNSTYDCMSFPFLYLFNGQWWGLSLFIPLGFWLNSKKFKAGYKCRTDIPEGKNSENFVNMDISRLALMTKVVARYTYTTLVPMKVYFFGLYGEFNRDFKDIYDDLHAWNRDFWTSLALCLTVFGIGCYVNFEMTMWFFLLVGIHSQFNLIGQFIAQRYLYFAMVGMCVVAGQLMRPFPELVIFVSGIFFLKTFQAIPAFKNQENLLLNELNMNPERGDTHSLVAQYYMHKKPLNEYPRWMINRISMLIRRSVDLNPRSWANRMNFAAFLAFIGRVSEAIEETKKTKELLKEVASNQQKPLLDKIDEQRIRFENILIEARRQYELDEKNKHRGR